MTNTNPPTNEQISLEVPYPFGLAYPIVVSERPLLIGDGTLSGSTKSQGTEVSRRVEIYDLETMTLIKALNSASNGVWSTSELPTDRMLRIIVIGEAGERDVTVKIEAI